MDAPTQFPAIVELNVGGTFFTTSLLTLTKCKGNMLSAMFSGKYDTVIDRNGRYFIDADGKIFIHILNYLRYGELPSSSLIETVYREALYFGISEMIEELEKHPIILAPIQRNKFRNNFPGYQDCLEFMVNHVSQSSEMTGTSSEVNVLLYAKENDPSSEDFSLHHICIYKAPSSNERNCVTFDARLGPWQLAMSENDVMKLLLFDLEAQGFTVTASCLGTCSYEQDDDQCVKKLFKFCFHWWKS